jgi:hypothetical protein
LTKVFGPNPLLRRILISLLLGLALGTALNEITFLFLRENARPPTTIELVIPAGTSEQVAQGVQPPSIPENMVFVVGDMLVVRNEDSVAHELGPLFVPSGSTASLHLDDAASYGYSCSFSPTKYIGLDVQEPLTAVTRLQGILFSGLPMAGLIALYSLVAWPLKKEGEAA